MNYCICRWLTLFSALLIALGGRAASLEAHDGLDSNRYLGWVRTTVSSRRIDGQANEIINPLRAGTASGAVASGNSASSASSWPEIATRSAVFRLGLNEQETALARRSAASVSIYAPVFEPRYSASALTKSLLKVKEAGAPFSKNLAPTRNSASIVIEKSSRGQGFFARASQFTAQGALLAGRIASELLSWLSLESGRVEKLLSVPAALDPARYSPFLKSLSSNPWAREKTPDLRTKKGLPKPAVEGYVISEFSRRPEGTAVTSANERRICYDGKCFITKGGNKSSHTAPAFFANWATRDLGKGEPVISKSFVTSFFDRCETLFRSLARFLSPMLRISAAPPQIDEIAILQLNSPSLDDLSEIPGIAGLVQTGIWIR